MVIAPDLSLARSELQDDTAAPLEQVASSGVTQDEVVEDSQTECTNQGEDLARIADIALAEGEASTCPEDEVEDGIVGSFSTVHDSAARGPVFPIRAQVKGRGKGGFRTVVVGVEEARAAMDVGLQTALDELPAELRRRLDALIADHASARRVKLPWTLKAKQRKAIHVWAEMHGLEHRSFGYRGKRRLHLIAPSADGEDGFEEEDWEGDN